MKERVQIGKNDPLMPGDIVEMHFKAVGPEWVYLKAAELSVLQWQLQKKNPNYELISWSNPPDKLILTFRVIELPAPSGPQVQQAGIGTAAVLAALVIGGGIFAWLSLETVYKIVDSPAGQVALAGAGSAGFGIAVIGIIAAYLMYKKLL